ncbi:nitroreductase family protein [Blautia liquoris]|uniref:Nitroreductase family protein n=1 Tax=Blautia liquoris TaxID=2779518 RepID=A0A7M2RJU6_9FIRM|nr:nitroreductase family protein [Blautia liquoris]QOV19837.1 nitroreductase family protein [Blautia liquoris]
MNLYEAIFVRKSVRNFSMENLSAQTLDKIQTHYDELTGLFGNFKTNIAILDNRKGQHKALSFFGVKAPYYLAFYSEEAPKYLMNVGYMMEQMVLYMCSIGIGTCYIGTNKVKKTEVSLNGLGLIGVVAFGKSKGSHVRKQSEAKRLSLDELCVFKEVPRQWMKQMLEAARLSPSSLNRQPWRFVVYDSRIHIFSKKDSVERLKKWDEVNFGIMFANMMVVAEELWLDVDLIKLEDISQKNFSNSQYVLSAILKP